MERKQKRKKVKRPWEQGPIGDIVIFSILKDSKGPMFQSLVDTKKRKVERRLGLSTCI